MADIYRNIYKTCRQAAGLTQEAAAERMGISVESLRAYENGYRIPPNDVVELMIILYNAQHLAALHLRETNALYGRIVPPLEDRALAELTIKIYNSLRRFTGKHSLDRLMEIAEDNIIDDAERPDFLDIVAELLPVTQVGLELQFHCVHSESETAD